MQNLKISGPENWVGLESNPEVLTEYAHKMGVSKYVLHRGPLLILVHEMRHYDNSTTFSPTCNTCLDMPGAGRLPMSWDWMMMR